MNDFDDLSDLDEVFGPLRSSATPAELSQQEEVVERMVKSRCTTKGKHMFTSRRARVATLVAAGVLGFGGMAAASPNFRVDQPTVPEPVVEPQPLGDETLEPTLEPTLDEVEPVTLEPVGEPEGVAPAEAVQVEPVVEEPAEDEPVAVPLLDDDATAFDETTCLPGNHGATVSAVARGEFGDGVSVSDAAKSSCGKTPKVDSDDLEIDDDADDEIDDDADDETETDTETEVEPAEERSGRDKGAASNENSSENSKAKAKGKGAPGKRGG